MIAHDAEDCECCEKAHELVADLDESNIVIERGAVELRKAQRRIEELEAQLADAEKRRCDYMCDACSLALAAYDPKWRAGK